MAFNPERARAVYAWADDGESDLQGSDALEIHTRWETSVW